MADNPNAPTRKPQGRALRFWRNLNLLSIFKAEAAVAQPGKRTGTRQRKVRWGRSGQRAAQRSNATARRRAKRAMTKAMQRRRRAKGLNLRSGW